jgi:hypothetical protein
VQEILEGKNPAANIEIKPNDIISVSEASSNMIYVIGAVQHASAFTAECFRPQSVVASRRTPAHDVLNSHILCEFGLELTTLLSPPKFTSPERRTAATSLISSS